MSFLNRFHGSRDIRFILKKGSHAKSELVSVRKYKSNKARIAVIVSKKVHKHAVVRNKIRRRIVSIVNAVRNDQNSTDDMIFIVKSSEVAKMDFDELEKQIFYLINQ